MEGKICVILPAAGVGERMKLHKPKQFCKVLGKPVISHTINAFERIPWVEHIIVVVSPESHQLMSDLCVQYGHTNVIITAGAATRHRSIYNGVKLAKTAEPQCDVVVIHDGVRPLVEADLLEKLVTAARQCGAAGVVRPLVSTVVQRGEEGFLEASLDRTQYRASEMPQAFRLSVISQAYSKCTDYDFDHGTECLHLAQEYAGVKVRLLDGPDYLWKVTHRKDLHALEGVLRDEQLSGTVHLTGFTGNTELLRRIQQALEDQAIPCRVQDQQTDHEDGIKQANARTVIFCQDQLQDSLPTKCRKLQEYGCERLIIIINSPCKDIDHTQKSLWDMLEDLNHGNSSNYTNMCCGIIIKDKDPGRVCSLITALLRNTEPALSGQVYRA